MKNSTKVAMLKNRRNILSARSKDNANIIKKIDRQIRNLGEN